MLEAAQVLDFERAAQLRDRIRQIKDLPTLTSDRPAPATEVEGQAKPGTPGTRVIKPRKRSRGQ